jgi:hypothetical protein
MTFLTQSSIFFEMSIGFALSSLAMPRRRASAWTDPAG